MKKNVFIVFLIISILLIVIIKNSNKKLITYKLNKNGIDFSISEKHNKENYYIEIKTKEHIYPIRLDGISGKRIVDNIYYYEDNNYECILPEFKSRINFDIMCFNKDILYDYSEIKNLDSSLDEFASSLKSYNLNHFSDDLTRTKIISDTTFYESNVIDKNAYITSYKGLTSIDNG